MIFNNIDDINNYYNKVKKTSDEYFDKYINQYENTRNLRYSDLRNAFQHVFGTVIIAEELGIVDAQFWGYAKEYLTKDDEINAHMNNRTYQEALSIVIQDTNRDLWNNNKGIEIAKTQLINHKTKDIIAQEILADMMNGYNSTYIIDLTDAREWKEGYTDENLWNEVKKETAIILFLNKKLWKKYVYPYYKSYNKNEHNLPQINISPAAYADEVNVTYKKAQEADGICVDPIILDLDGNGLQISSGTTYFDYDNDGFAERVAWAGDGNGVLILDSNNNGIIDGSSEILTALTLSSLDSNNDGIINYEDDYFDSLRITDTYGDIYTLDEAGVASINTTISNVNEVDENGNVRFGEGTFERTDGTTGTFGEYEFVTDLKDTQLVNVLEETSTVEALPDMEGAGRLYSLH